ncbi:MAG: aspartate aminotransferase family protein [Armatimonadetes bacterium 13_1_40CM_3_65_7]|nr:MAG: aspartate aminotransferase family protein [Armatimonadetes bacterium 13_1_40CM_3_65_7]
MDTRTLLTTDLAALIHPLHHPADHQAPVVFVSGQGAVLRDADGHEYLDGLSSLWNVNAGHGRTELAEAAAAQMRNLAFASAYTGYTNPPAIRLAERLLRVAYPNLSGVYFTTAGAESNETAFKIVRYFWRRQGRPGKTKVISRIHGYHGVTMAAMSATGIPSFHTMFQPVVPGFTHVVPSYPYRYPGSGAAALEEAIMREGPDTVAAFIAEPVIGAGGVIPPTPDYFPAVREICDRHHVLFIADEIITGFGRTGRWFALDHWGVQPDLVTFAKGVTSAYLPLGGVMVSRRVHEAIVQAPMSERFMHAATYSGHPTCCAVGLANLDIFEREQLVERGAAMGARLQQKAQSLRPLPIVGDVRGVGLMCGIELVADKATKAPALQVGGKILGEARRRGLITRIRTGQAGAHPIGDTICLAPPLVVSEAQIDRMIEILRESITAVA